MKFKKYYVIAAEFPKSYTINYVNISALLYFTNWVNKVLNKNIPQKFLQLYPEFVYTSKEGNKVFKNLIITEENLKELFRKYIKENGYPLFSGKIVTSTGTSKILEGFINQKKRHIFNIYISSLQTVSEIPIEKEKIGYNIISPKLIPSIVIKGFLGSFSRKLINYNEELMGNYNINEENLKMIINDYFNRQINFVFDKL